jgi:hypothetical protein
MRYWTEDEARAYLPRLKALVAVIRRATHLEIRARGNGHANLPRAADPGRTSGRSHEAAGGGDGSNGDAPADEVPAGLDAETAMRELDAQGIILRDPRRGLIDFPAQHPGGRDVLLCWQLGEDDLAWWHLPEDGFAGRRPLPLPPEL